MVFFAAILSLIPLAAFVISRRASRDEIPAAKTALWTLAVFALGLLPALPFLTGRGVGSGEAYNYSLALADFVTQVRQGEVPPLAGQTEYAFNGRVHPLCNAPYLFYLAATLDALSAHRLTFWELQNLSLVFSLVAAAFTAYGSLRWGAGCSRPAAFFLTASYVFCPAMLANSTVNLFMTIHAAVFVPVAIGACVRQSREYSLRADVLFAAALAATWLAHPPVALWLTVVTGLVRLSILWRNPHWKVRAGLLGAALLGLALAGFVFASVSMLGSGLGYFPNGAKVQTEFVNSVMANIRAAFPGSLRPVSATADSLRDLQLGYVCWALFAAAAVYFLRLRPRPDDADDASRRHAGLSLLGVALLLLLLVIPVKYVTRWLWTHVPLAAATTTAPWPMQRLYLIAAGLTIFAAALALPAKLPGWRGLPKALLAFCAFGSLWMIWETSLFIRRDFQLRWTADATTRSHASSNLDLTVTSYAYLKVPPTFVNGVMDPGFEFRLLKNGKEEIASPLKAAEETGGIVTNGTMTYQPVGGKPAIQTHTDPLVLAPGQRYLLTFDFLTPAFEGTVDVIGPVLLRHYALPSAGEPLGFGMGENQPHSFPVWTSLAKPEPVELRITLTKPLPEWTPGTKIANFSLRTVDPERLPVRLESLLPLRCTVTAPGLDCMLVTPRRYLPGYAAFVNERSTQAVRSPEGNIMLPVPAGESSVKLRYVGTPLVRAAFWTSAFSWLALAIWAGGVLAGVRWAWVFEQLWRSCLPPVFWIGRHKTWIVTTAAVAVLAFMYAAQRNAYLHSVGPVHIRFQLPLKKTGRQQPLLVTGRTGQGANVFVTYLDEKHVRIGADIWGTLYESAPFAADYTQVQDIVINSSALYPLDHPRVRALPPSFREQLRHDFRVELNGRTAIHEQREAYESAIEEVTVGLARIGVSTSEQLFEGKILQVERLPFQQQRQLVLSRDQNARLRLKFPAERFGLTETLLSLGLDGEAGVCAITYGSGGRARLSYRDRHGTLIESAKLVCDPSRVHQLDIAVGQAPEPAKPVALQVSFDGRRVLGPENLTVRETPFVLQAGLALAEVPGVDVRFTGPELAIQPVLKNGAALPKNTEGPLRFVVIFPKDKPGRPEPLLSTGKNGQGDFAYVTYLNANQVRFGFDHWGIGSAASEPVAVDYHAPHEIEISLSSLYPAANDPSWKNVPADVRTRLQSQMEIRLDGKTVLRGDWPAHPSTPEEVTPGQNRIGGSNCDPLFTGEILASERLGWPR